MHYSQIAANYPKNILPRDFFQWLLFFFIIGTLTLSHVHGLSTIMVLYGLAFSFLFLIYLLYHGLKVQPEVIIYFAWVMWSLCGLLNVVDRSLYFQELRTVFQMAVMILVIAGIISLKGNMSVTMLAIIAGGMILAFNTLITGEFQQLTETETNMRLEGWADNANEFAYQFLFVIFAVFYLWKNKSSLWWRGFLSLITVAAFSGIVYSGSRKGFLGLLAFLFLWWLFCQGKRLSRHPIKVYGGLLIALVCFYYLAGNVMSSTNLGKRLQQIEDSSNQTRIQMYKDGFEMIKKNPIVGVGLDNYRALSTSGLYSHSDYIEVAANTGIVGFVLYFSIYVILWRRLNHLKALVKDPHILYTVGLLKAAIITILLIAFGRPNITSKLTWIFLATAIGFSWSIERSLKKLRLHYKEMRGRAE